MLAASLSLAGLLSITSPTLAQSPAAPTPKAEDSSAPKAAAVQPTPGVRYQDGQLEIDLANTTLAEVLRLVADRTGVKVDTLADVGQTRLSIIKFGPGPARQVLAALLTNADCDFLIQGFEADPVNIQSVLVMPSEKSGSRGNTDAFTAPVRATAEKVLELREKPEEAAALLSSKPSETEVVAANDPGPPPTLAPHVPMADSSSVPLLNGVRTGPLSPPPVMSSESITQQLQQMYQQRAQINQQEHSPANH